MNVQRHIRYSQEQPVSEIIHSCQDIRVVLINLMPGQMVPPQTSSSSICLLVIEGHGECLSGGDWTAFGTGTLRCFPPNEPFGIRATSERLSILETLAPLP